ncbi:paraquat-inducible protein A [Sulfitobacter albidus]|uniref:Paraquat-inducible protein A n=1 Tax=Sulfitobacter albidus TaxID=2829501 RepID=A0A975JCQ6_9RHOB|nr:paraquat-inducible protein A [Sulfitobacter albidus]QUJ75942.1 paraquat-inducible protein A [Sulfitobacter albidus]
MSLAEPPFENAPLDELIVCPVCDATYVLQRPAHGERAVCTRCHKVLIAPRRKAGMQIIAVSIAVVILIVAAGVFPFLSISAAGKSNAVSILDAALTFTEGPMLVLALLTAGFIFFVPLLRMLLTLYVLVPLVRDRPPARHAIPAFRLSEALRPWSMAEIFALGCAVALVKVADLATVNFGPAFWMFGILVVLVMAQDGFMCKWSVWNALENPKKR